jgi:hypothetical protein
VIVSSRGFTKSAVTRGDEIIDLPLLEYDRLFEEYSDAFDNCLVLEHTGDKNWEVDFGPQYD